MPRVLMIVGSLRDQSFNRQLAREVIHHRRRAEVEELDWHDVPS
ncbi:MAG: NADPH-dependent FMN reductase [Collinsella intestinalis]